MSLLCLWFIKTPNKFSPSAIGCMISTPIILFYFRSCFSQEYAIYWKQAILFASPLSSASSPPPMEPIIPSDYDITYPIVESNLPRSSSYMPVESDLTIIVCFLSSNKRSQSHTSSNIILMVCHLMLHIWFLGELDVRDKLLNIWLGLQQIWRLITCALSDVSSGKVHSISNICAIIRFSPSYKAFYDAVSMCRDHSLLQNPIWIQMWTKGTWRE